MNNKDTARVPSGKRVYAIGDIHGADATLKELLTLIADDMTSFEVQDATVVFLGDYINRGANPRGVIDILTQLPLAPAHHVFLRGNHEDTLLRAFHDAHARALFFRQGGLETLQSYDIPLELEEEGALSTARRFALFSENLPQGHRRFLENLRLFVRIGDYLFVHAGIRPGVPLNKQTTEDLVAIREPFLSGDNGLGLVVVHGHTRVTAPLVKRRRIGIDTGAFRTGRLTCLVLEGKTRRFISTGA